VFIWYSFPVLVCLDQEKSGNPAVVQRFSDGSIQLQKAPKTWKWMLKFILTMFRVCMYLETHMPGANPTYDRELPRQRHE
jgi:hypothetical protein